MNIFHGNNVLLLLANNAVVEMHVKEKPWPQRRNWLSQ